jgi:uncharacterized protein (DUF58 family)
VETAFFEPGDYELVKQMKLAVKRKVAGLATGEQRSPVKGGGIEFADYREYIPGDDVRQVDWSVFLRFRKLVVKLCAEEKELTLMVILDSSRSMNFGAPDKFRIAKRIGGILAGIAIQNGNRAGIVSLGKKLHEAVRPERNRVALTSLVRSLGALDPVEFADPSACVREFAARYGGKCVAVFLSDLLFPQWEDVIGVLAASRCESYVVQILDRTELDPPRLGELTLVDIEDGSEVPLHIDRETTRRYLKELDGFLFGVERLCKSRGIGYSLVPTDTALAGVFHQDLIRGGLLC